MSEEKCPKCGCQTRDPFGFGKVIHNVELCGVVSAECDCGKIEHGRHHADCPALKPVMSAEKCPVCGEFKKYVGYCNYICGAEPCGDGCNRAKSLAIERAAEVERLRAKLDKWESELSKVMPPDFKDWWQNSRDEWPVVARLVIESLRSQIKDLEEMVAMMSEKFSKST